jgi:hypothetical protein
VEIGTDLPEDGFTIYSGNLARYDAGTAASQYTFSFPEGTPAGYYYVAVDCTTYQEHAAPIVYGYLGYADVKVGHPETDQAAALLTTEPASWPGRIQPSSLLASNVPVVARIKHRMMRVSGTSEEGLACPSRQHLAAAQHLRAACLTNTVMTSPPRDHP